MPVPSRDEAAPAVAVAPSVSSDDAAFYQRLRREIDQWERDGTIDAGAARALRRRHGFDRGRDRADASTWIRRVLYLAVFAFLAAFFSFAGSGTLSPAARVGILVGTSGAASAAGAFLYRRRRSEAMALLVLSGLLLPVAFWFLVEHYALWVPSTPLAWWCALAAALACAYLFAAVRRGDEGLGGAGVLSACAVPLLAARALELPPGAWAPGIALLGAACAASARVAPRSWLPAVSRPCLLLAMLLGFCALALPFVLGTYGGGGTALALLVLAAGCFAVAMRDGREGFLIPAVLCLAGSVGVLMIRQRLALEYLPLLQVGLSATLVAAGFLVLRSRAVALRLLLALILLLQLPGLVGLVALPVASLPPMARHPLLLALLVHGGAGLALAVLSWRFTQWRALLAHLGAVHLFAAVALGNYLRTGDPGIESYSLPLGALLLVEALFLDDTLVLLAGIAAATGPSLVLSVHDGGVFRTVLLALAGVALVALGAFRSDGKRLLAGILVLVPSLLLKLLPGLADLGVPRFVWFGLCGGLLVAVAVVLQRRAPRI